MTPGELSWWSISGAVLLALLVWQLKVVIDIYAHPLLARLGWKRRRAPRRYVRALFDCYARDFDRHLLHDLEYEGANLLSSALNDDLARHPRPIERALDLGCGTGICGVLLKPRVKWLAGVDLSQEMIRAAATRKAYDALYVADIEEFLRYQRSAFDLITAADVLVYFGDLRTLLASTARALIPEGVFIFTTEALAEGDYLLLPTGRFGHHPGYVASTARDCGLLVQSQDPVTLRRQADLPVAGHLHVLSKATDDRLDPGRCISRAAPPFP